MSDAVICPSCNKEMVLRRARRGRNAGGLFYGCSNYPKCRETLPYLNDTNEQNNSTPITNYEVNNSGNNYISIPREFKARSLFKGYQTKFFDTLAVHNDSLKFRTENKEFNSKLESISKWRVDYPIIDKHQLPDNMMHVLSVIEKILLRGNITRLSKALEDKIMSMKFDYQNASDFLDLSSKMPEYRKWFDGYGTEELFYYKTLPEILGPNYRDYVIPQVFLSSLLKANHQLTDEQRIDFLISLPDKKIVIELDGKEHEQHQEKDKLRQRLLEKEGYIVYRIPNQEINDGHGESIEDLIQVLKCHEHNSVLFGNEIRDLVIKLVHQFQVCLLEAIYSGTIDTYKKAYVKIDHLNFNLNQEDLLYISQIACDDFCELANNILSLYGLKNQFDIQAIEMNSRKKQNCICISYGEDAPSNCPTFYVQNFYWDHPILFNTRSYLPITLKEPNVQNLEFLLNYIFRKQHFREGQFEAISRASTGNDAIVLLPTGHGKSIAFQLASFLLPGVSVVIDPILSLIDDQIENLRLAGIDRCIGISSQISNRDGLEQIIELFARGQYQFCYVAPERFQTKRFREALRTLTVSIPICLIAVDEAHCVSEWGHDFRTSYLNLGRISREYCSSKGFVPPLLALTGTASRVVLKDVIRVLHIEDFESIITPTTFDREELQFEIIRSQSREKFQVLQGVMNNLIPNKYHVSAQHFYQENGEHTFSGLVFCPHVNGEYGVFNIFKDIYSKITRSVDFYSGQKPKYYSYTDYDAKKKTTAQRFKYNKIQILVATKAFGMGIDKPNIRFTVHYGIPGSIEAFYQEAGRAGRDRNISHSIIIYSNDDEKFNRTLLDPNLSYEDVQDLLKEDLKDDISRALFFHNNAFRGVKEELKFVETVLGEFSDITRRSEYAIIADSKNRNDFEKGLHRLLTLGVVIDYTIDYSSNEFTVYTSGIGTRGVIDAYADYVSGYHRGRMNEERRKAEELQDLPFKSFIYEMSKLLITFIYDVIERSRRRSLSEISLLCSDSKTNKQIRERILRYLQTEYSESIELLLDEEDSGLEQMKNIIESVRSLKDASSIRGEVSRYLESFPDHPGLLFLRGIVELYTEEKNILIAEQNILAAITNGLQLYGLTPLKMYDSIGWTMSVLFERDKKFVAKLLKDLVKKIQTREFLRELMLYLPGELNDYVALKLLNAQSKNLLREIGKEH